MLLCMPTRIPVSRGRGLQPGVDLTDNAALEDLMEDLTSASPDGNVQESASRAGAASQTDIYSRPGETREENTK